MLPTDSYDNYFLFLAKKNGEKKLDYPGEFILSFLFLKNKFRQKFNIFSENKNFLTYLINFLKKLILNFNLNSYI